MVRKCTIFLGKIFIFQRSVSILYIQESQFALVGDTGEATTESSLSMMREADHIFTLWCSGRSYMEGMLVTLKMIKRQDVFSQVNQKVRP